MNPNATHSRRARLQRDCEVSIGPALLLFVACAGVVVMLGLSALLNEVAPAQAAESTRQTMPPATAKPPRGIS